MKINFKKLLALVLTGVMLLSVFAGCSKQQNKVSSDSLVITVAKLGYGDDWLKAIAAAYEEKTGIDVEIISKIGDTGLSAIKGEMQSQVSETDIFFTRAQEFFKSIYKGGVNIGGTNYDCEFADLTDVWNSVASEGEGKTIKEKMDPAFEEYYNVDGKYYGLPWANGIMGIVRNKNVWDKLGLTDEDMPRTTEELFALCDRVKAQGTAPFIYSLEAEYYSSVAPVWFSQYEGSESMAYYNNGLDPMGESSFNLYAYDGQVEALKVIQKLVDNNNGYQHSMSSSSSFTDMQSVFMLDEALFCVNGAWLETEMGNAYQNTNIDFIKMPVISSLINRLETVSNDETLSAVVKYVDGEGEAPAGVSQEDIAIVRDARQNSYTRSGFDHTALVPAYSNQLDTAKDFLKFMCSDEGLNLYYEATNGNQLPIENTAGYSSSVEISTFRQSVNEVLTEGCICEYDGYVKAKVYAIGGVSRYWYNGSNNFVRALLDGSTPEEICAKNNKYLQNNWSSITGY